MSFIEKGVRKRGPFEAVNIECANGIEIADRDDGHLVRHDGYNFFAKVDCEACTFQLFAKEYWRVGSNPTDDKRQQTMIMHAVEQFAKSRGCREVSTVPYEYNEDGERVAGYANLFRELNYSTTMLGGLHAWVFPRWPPAMYKQL